MDQSENQAFKRVFWLLHEIKSDFKPISWGTFNILFIFVIPDFSFPRVEISCGPRRDAHFAVVVHGRKHCEQMEGSAISMVLSSVRCDVFLVQPDFRALGTVFEA